MKLESGLDAPSLLNPATLPLGACGQGARNVAIGGVAGPLLSGVLVPHLGFHIAFYAFTALAVTAAAVFSMFVTETRPANWDNSL